MIALILLADDNDEFRTQLKEYLESKNHRVLEATDGAQAFAVAEKEMPHLIIMDVVMPGVYGSTATAKIQEYWRTSRIPILLLSGSADKSVLAHVPRRKSVRFMKKPVKLEELDKAIGEMLPEGGYTR